MASRVRDKLLVKETRRGDVDRVAELIHAGTDVNKLASDGCTALMRAASYGHTGLVEMLLREGADQHRDDSLVRIERLRCSLLHAVRPFGRISLAPHHEPGRPVPVHRPGSGDPAYQW